jgi:hypothetical protein
LYSGNTGGASLILSPNETLAKGPAYMKKIMTADHTLKFVVWNMQEMHTIANPTPYVFKTGGAGLCPYLDYPASAMLRIYTPPPYYSLHRKYKDTPLCP